MISANLSRENFSAANSSRYGLYFSSEADVRLEAYPNRCKRVTFLPPGKVDVMRWVKMPANASLDPSVVIVKGVPSNNGDFRTGSETSHCLISTKILSCSVVQMPSSL